MWFNYLNIDLQDLILIENDKPTLKTAYNHGREVNCTILKVVGGSSPSFHVQGGKTDFFSKIFRGPGFFLFPELQMIEKILDARILKKFDTIKFYKS